MTELQKEFEVTGYTSWINSDIYPDGKIYTKEYTEWLEEMAIVLRQPDVIKSDCDCDKYQVCGICFKEKGWIIKDGKLIEQAVL